MKIRKEDKRLIHHLATVGAFICTCWAVWFVINNIDNSRALAAKETGFIQGASAINRVDPEMLTPGSEITNDIVKTLSAELSASHERLAALQKSLWTTLPPWLLILLAALSGCTAGYAGIRLFTAFMSFVMYCCIRGLYRLIRAVDPDCTAAEVGVSPAVQFVQRDPYRVLPAMIKLGVLLTLTLLLLAVLVWQWTSIPAA